MSDPLATEQMRRYDDLLGKRKAERDVDWQSIAQYCLPQESDITTEKTENVSGWTDRIFETTAIRSMDVLAAGLYNWWTPQNQPWAEYDTPEELKQEGDSADDDAKMWLGRGSDRAMRELGRSNFYAVKETGDAAFARFATDLILVDESNEGTELFNFVHCKIGTYVIEENYKGIVDTVRRELGDKHGLEFRKIEQMFNQPGDMLPDKMREQARGVKGASKKFKILHCIFPRGDSERLPKAKDGKNMPVASVYISMDFKEVIRVSGYHETPILCRRFKKWVTQWGYGPGYLILPDARQINYMQQYMDAAAEILVDPRVLIPDNLEGDVDLRAGGTTTFDTSNPEGKPSEWAHAVEYKLGMDLMEQKRQAIRDACFNDAFKLLNSAPLLEKEMTAYEISQRLAEQMQNITAVDARQVIEFINPLMTRVFGIMFRAGKLKNAPQSLMQKTGEGSSGLVMPEIVVTSRFSAALRALKNRGTEETFKFVIPIVNEAQRPEVLDNFDLDKDVREYAFNTGMAPDSLRKIKGPNSVTAIREQRAKLQQQQRALAAAEQMGKAGKGLGGSPEFMQEMAKDAMSKQAKAG